MGVAFLFGALIGAERQHRLKHAGLRTNTLVCLGSAAFILLSISLTDATGDPSRIASQIVTGVGFLGGGLILKDGISVRGLNTAATIWCSAAVGAMAGLGLIWQAFITVVFVIVTNSLLRPLGDRLSRRNVFKNSDEEFCYTFTVHCKESVENHIREMILTFVRNNPHLHLSLLKSADSERQGYSFIIAGVLSAGKNDLMIEKLAARLTDTTGVTGVSWEGNLKNIER